MIYEPHDYMHYKHLIPSMKTKSLDVYFMQETWLEGDVVAIILLPRYCARWKATKARSPITTDAAGKFAGRYISINVILNSRNRMGKQVRGKKGDKHLTLTLASVYHPCTKTGSEDVYVCFLDTLDTLLSTLPPHN